VATGAPVLEDAPAQVRISGRAGVSLKFHRRFTIRNSTEFEPQAVSAEATRASVRVRARAGICFPTCMVVLLWSLAVSTCPDFMI
jgi:hypothetical protein